MEQTLGALGIETGNDLVRNERADFSMKIEQH
jgi:hypothetical protein